MSVPPVRWHAAKPSNFLRRRAGHAPIAEVDHRMVGWLLGTRRYFTTSSPRPVSTHFGIGHEGRTAAGVLLPLCPVCGPINGARGPLVIDQYVDLADTAYGNGNYDASGGWTLTQRSNGQVVNPNLYTYSIEHEDGATAGRGIVTDHVRQASVELTALLHRGDVVAIRAAGIRIGGQAWHNTGDGPAMALALRRIPVATERFIDHHRIAGRLKPYCWQPWLADRGFVGGGTQAAIIHRLTPVSTTHPAGAAAFVSFPQGTYRTGRVSGGRFLGDGPDLRTGGFSGWAAAPAELTNPAGATTTWFRMLSGAHSGRWFYRFDHRLTWRPV